MGNRSWLLSLFVAGLLLSSSTALAQNSCRRQCRSEGLCNPQAGRCVAVSDEECRDSEGCEDEGRCTARNGGCVATSHEECRRSGQCQYAGRCHARDGECVATEPRHCSQSGLCVNDGRCSLADGRCVVATDADCRRSYSCRMAGACTARDGRCVAASSADCRASDACEATGHCVLVPGRGCAVGATADCQASPACQRYGLCAAGKNQCRATRPSHCTQSSECAERAACSFNAEQRRCEVGSEADCRRTAACKSRNVCIFHEGRCYTEAGAERARKGPTQSLIKALSTARTKSPSASLQDVITNIDSVRSSTGAGLFKVTGLITSLPGGKGVVGKGGGGRVGGAVLQSPGSGSIRPRGKVRGRVTRMSSQLQVEGEMERADVIRAVNARMGAFSRCYERRLVANPSLSGRIIFGWTISDTGRVTAAEVRGSTVPDPDVAACCISIIRRMRFPRPGQGNVTISYPFIFRAVQL